MCFCCILAHLHKQEVKYKPLIFHLSVRLSIKICIHVVSRKSISEQIPVIILLGIHFLTNKDFNNAASFYEHDLFFSGLTALPFLGRLFTIDP